MYRDIIVYYERKYLNFIIFIYGCKYQVMWQKHTSVGNIGPISSVSVEYFFPDHSQSRSGIRTTIAILHSRYCIYDVLLSEEAIQMETQLRLGAVGDHPHPIVRPSHGYLLHHRVHKLLHFIHVVNSNTPRGVHKEGNISHITINWKEKEVFELTNPQKYYNRPPGGGGIIRQSSTDSVTRKRIGRGMLSGGRVFNRLCVFAQLLVFCRQQWKCTDSEFSKRRFKKSYVWVLIKAVVVNNQSCFNYASF